MNILHPQGKIIRDRYQIVTTIGQGGMGITYAAVDLTNSQNVALKMLSLQQANDWKIVELFERESKILANLNHPAIPRYLDYFEIDTSDNKSFYIVQELIVGESLAKLIESDWQPTDAEVIDIALQVLDILVYLHSLTPPVIHRDIKPQNIIRQADGKVCLVDFGAVQAVYRNTISISGTFVGTLGYMSPEQLRGNVFPASDLYSLGCSLIFLLAKKCPTDLPQTRMKIDFRSATKVSDNFAYWLDKMLEPVIEKRWQSASEAKRSLKSSLSNTDNITTINPSTYSKIILHKEPYKLCFEIVSSGFNAGHLILLTVGISFVVISSLFIFSGSMFPIFHFLAGWGALIAGVTSIWYENKKQTSLEITPQKFKLYWTELKLFKVINRHVEGNTNNIGWVNANIDVKKQKNRKIYTNSCAISIGENEYKFGQDYQLTRQDADLITQEIKNFLKQLRM